MIFLLLLAAVRTKQMIPHVIYIYDQDFTWLCHESWQFLPSTEDLVFENIEKNCWLAISMLKSLLSAVQVHAFKFL